MTKVVELQDMQGGEWDVTWNVVWNDVSDYLWRSTWDTMEDDVRDALWPTVHIVIWGSMQDIIN